MKRLAIFWPEGKLTHERELAATSACRVTGDGSNQFCQGRSLDPDVSVMVTVQAL